MTLLLFLWATARFQGEKVEIVETKEGRVTVLSGQVRIEEEKTTITARSALFYNLKNWAVVKDSVRIVAPDFEIRTDSAFYDLSARTAELSGAVTIDQKGRTIETSNLSYDYVTDVARFPAPLTIRDTARHLVAYGLGGSYDFRAERGDLFPEPSLVLADRETTRVLARRMLLDSKASLFWAEESVRLTSGKSRLAAETLRFDLEKDTGLAWGKSTLADEHSLCAGDTVFFALKDNALSSLVVTSPEQGTYITNEGDSLVFGGSRLTLAFEEGKISSLHLERPTPLALWRHPKVK